MKISHICTILNINPLSQRSDIERAKATAIRNIQAGPEASTEQVKITSAYNEAIREIEGKTNLLHMVKSTEDLQELLKYLPIDQSIDLLNALQDTPPINLSATPSNTWFLSASFLGGHMAGSQAIQCISMSILLASAIKHAANYFSNRPETQLLQLIKNKEDLKQILSNLPEEKIRYILMLIRHMRNYQTIAQAEILSEAPSNPNTSRLITNMFVNQSITSEDILAECIKYLPTTAQITIHQLKAQIYQTGKIRHLISDSYIINDAETKLIALFEHNQENAIRIITVFLSILEENAAREKKHAKTQDLIENFSKINDSYPAIRYLYSSIYNEIIKDADHTQKLQEFNAILRDQLPIDLYAQLYNALAEDVAFNLTANMSPNRLIYYTMSEAVTIEEHADPAFILLNSIRPRTDVVYDLGDDGAILEFRDAVPSIASAAAAAEDDEAEQQWVKVSHNSYENSHDCLKDNLYAILQQITPCLNDIIKSLNKDALIGQSEEKTQHKIRSIIKIKLAFEQLNKQKALEKPNDVTINTFIALCRIAIEACNFETGTLAEYTKMVTKKIDEKCKAEFTGARSKQKLIELLEKNDLIFPKELYTDQLSNKINFCLMNNLSPINTCILFDLQHGMQFKPYNTPASWDEYARDMARDGLSKLTYIAASAVSVVEPASQRLRASVLGLFAEMMSKHLKDQAMQAEPGPVPEAAPQASGVGLP